MTPPGASAPAPPLLARLRAIPARVWGLLLLVGLGVGAAGWALVGGQVTPRTIQAMVAAAGPWAMAAYVVAVVAGELLWFPRMWGLVAGGALFGPVWGGVLSFGADLLGAALCYGIARGAGRAWVASLLARRPRAERVVDLVARRRGGTMVAILRVCPVAHYTLVSYAAGVGGVGPAPFLLGTAAGIVPGAIIYPIFGDAMLRPGSPLFIGSLALVAVALVVTTFYARRLLREG